MADITKVFTAQLTGLTVTGPLEKLDHFCFQNHVCI